MKKQYIISIVFVLALSIFTCSAWAWNPYIMGSVNQPVGCTGGSDGAIGNSSADNYAPQYQCESSCTTNYVYYSAFTPSEDGTVTYIHGSVYSCGLSYRLCIWGNDGTLLAYGSEHEGTNATAPDKDTAHDALNVSVCLASGTTYKIGVWIEADNYSSCEVSGTWGSGSTSYKALTAYNTAWDGNADGTQTANYPIRCTVNNSADAF